MGAVATITSEKFPKQSDKIGKKVTVCYHFDTSKTHSGVIVRDDIEVPHVTIFKLDNGRHILSTECQYKY